MDWMKKVFPYIFIVIISGVVLLFLVRWLKFDDREVIREQGVIKHSDQWWEIEPEIVTEIDESELPEDNASEEIMRLREQVEWYATYTAQLEEQFLSGGADIEQVEKGDITLNFSGERDFGRYDGSCGILNGEGWHELKLIFNPIPLRLYYTGEKVHITTPAEWIRLGDVEVVRARPEEHWYDNVRFGVMAGVGHSEGGYSPAIGVKITVGGWGGSLVRGGDETAVMVVKEWGW